MRVEEGKQYWDRKGNHLGIAKRNLRFPGESKYEFCIGGITFTGDGKWLIDGTSSDRDIDFGYSAAQVGGPKLEESEQQKSSASEQVERADQVNHPQHYTQHPSGVECIQITEHMGFNLGNAMKYIWRADLKADAIQDLQKAMWYVSREIEKRLKASLAVQEVRQ